MKKSKVMKLQVKPAYSGKVKLETGEGTTLLDENTPQEVLAQFYVQEVGKGFIELVPDVSTPKIAEK